MQAVRDGDVSQLGHLFERYHSRLFEFLSRMTGNRVAAEDLVQDVFGVGILKYRHVPGRRRSIMAVPNRRNAAPTTSLAVPVYPAQRWSRRPSMRRDRRRARDGRYWRASAARRAGDRRELIVLRGTMSRQTDSRAA